MPLPMISLVAAPAWSWGTFAWGAAAGAVGAPLVRPLINNVIVRPLAEIVADGTLTYKEAQASAMTRLSASRGIVYAQQAPPPGTMSVSLSPEILAYLGLLNPASQAPVSVGVQQCPPLVAATPTAPMPCITTLPPPPAQYVSTPAGNFSAQGSFWLQPHAGAPQGYQAPSAAPQAPSAAPQAPSAAPQAPSAAPSDPLTAAVTTGFDHLMNALNSLGAKVDALKANQQGHQP